MRRHEHLLLPLFCVLLLVEHSASECCMERCNEVLDGTACALAEPNKQCPSSFWGKCNCEWTIMGNNTFECLAVLQNFPEPEEDDSPTQLLLIILLPLLGLCLCSVCTAAHIIRKWRDSHKDDDDDTISDYSDATEEEREEWRRREELKAQGIKIGKHRRRSSGEGGHRRRSSVEGLSKREREARRRSSVFSVASDYVRNVLHIGQHHHHHGNGHNGHHHHRHHHHSRRASAERGGRRMSREDRKSVV